MSVLEQGIDKLERTRQALADPQSAPELLLHLRGLRRVRDAAALLRQAAAAAAGPSPAFSPQLLPITPASACPELFRGLAELAVGLAECKAASDSRTLPDGLDALLCDRRTGMLRAMVETSPAVGMTLTCLVRGCGGHRQGARAREVKKKGCRRPTGAVQGRAATDRTRGASSPVISIPNVFSTDSLKVWRNFHAPAGPPVQEAREVRTPLAAVAALAVFAVVGDSDDAQRVRCAWGSLHAVLAAVWPDSGSPARLRALERGDWVPPPPSAAGAPADASTDSPGAGPRGLGGGGLQGTAAVGTLAAALAADLASHAPGITLPGLHAAALTIMAGLFAGRAQLGAPQMQQLLVRVHDVPAGAAAGCFQLAHVGQAAGRAGFLSARRLERLAAYMDGAQALAASSQCEWQQQGGSPCLACLPARPDPEPPAGALAPRHRPRCYGCRHACGIRAGAAGGVFLHAAAAAEGPARDGLAAAGHQRALPGARSLGCGACSRVRDGAQALAAAAQAGAGEGGASDDAVRAGACRARCAGPA